MVRPAGLEPATFGSGGQRSIQLSYGREEAIITRTPLALQAPEAPEAPEARQAP